MTHVEARVTINMPGVTVGQVVLVDPDLPYIAMCLDSGALVRTGRSFSVPTRAARQAVRPPANSAPVEAPKAAPAAAPRRKRAPRAKTPPS